MFFGQKLTLPDLLQAGFECCIDQLLVGVLRSEKKQPMIIAQISLDIDTFAAYNSLPSISKTTHIKPESRRNSVLYVEIQKLVWTYQTKSEQRKNNLVKPFFSHRVYYKLMINKLLNITIYRLLKSEHPKVEV